VGFFQGQRSCRLAPRDLRAYNWAALGTGSEKCPLRQTLSRGLGGLTISSGFRLVISSLERGAGLQGGTPFYWEKRHAARNVILEISNVCRGQRRDWSQQGERRGMVFHEGIDSIDWSIEAGGKTLDENNFTRVGEYRLFFSPAGGGRKDVNPGKRANHFNR